MLVSIQRPSPELEARLARAARSEKLSRGGNGPTNAERTPSGRPNDHRSGRTSDAPANAAVSDVGTVDVCGRWVARRLSGSLVLLGEAIAIGLLPFAVVNTWLIAECSENGAAAGSYRLSLCRVFSDAVATCCSSALKVS